MKLDWTRLDGLKGGDFEIWTSAGHVQRTLRTVRGGGVFLKDGRVFRIAGEGGDL